MVSDNDLDALMTAYCEGIYAMDPRTTYPFWDYDFAPLFSDTWIAKLLATTVACRPLDSSELAHLFSGPSVPRKELIYSLFDLKVARIGRDERLRQVSFWVDLLKTWCGSDWLSNGSNQAPNLDRPSVMMADAPWIPTDRTGGRAVGHMTAALNSLAYGLYSDVFVHQCAEFRGPYKVAPPVSESSAGRHRLLVRSWSGLRPYGLHPECQDPGYDKVVIAAVYDCEFAIDIYNHVSWNESPVDHMRQYAVWIDARPSIISPGELASLAQSVAGLAETTFRWYRDLGFEDKKRLWVRQRNYQFRRLFRSTGLREDAPEMEAAVAGKPLSRSPLWNSTLPKEQIFDVWRQCLDPRTEIYYDDWPGIFHAVFGNHPRPLD